MATSTKIVLGLVAVVLVYLWYTQGGGQNTISGLIAGGDSAGALATPTLVQTADVGVIKLGTPGVPLGTSPVYSGTGQGPAEHAGTYYDSNGNGYSAGQVFGTDSPLVVPSLIGAWGGVDSLVSDLVPADQTQYPGWYKTGDGGWYNPSTGESFSPGSSPPASDAPDLSALPTFDVNAIPIDLGTANRLPYDPNQVIY